MPVTRRRGTSGPASAGTRDRLVRVEWRPADDAVEPSGFPRDAWTHYRDVYMSREPLSSDERFVSDQTTAAAMTRWECEYLADLDPDTVDVPKRVQLVYQGRRFDVLGAATVGRARALEFVTGAGSGIGGA